MSMVDSQINFHSLESLRSYVQFGKPDLESELRVQELKASREQLLALIQKAKDNSSLRIEAAFRFSIDVKDQPEEHIQKLGIATCAVA